MYVLDWEAAISHIFVALLQLSSNSKSQIEYVELGRVLCWLYTQYPLPFIAYTIRTWCWVGFAPVVSYWIHDLPALSCSIWMSGDWFYRTVWLFRWVMVVFKGEPHGMIFFWCSDALMSSRLEFPRPLFERGLVFAVALLRPIFNIRKSVLVVNW